MALHIFVCRFNYCDVFVHCRKWRNWIKPLGRVKHLYVEEFAGDGHLQLLQWAKKHKLNMSRELCLTGAARGGHLPVLEWFVVRYNELNSILKSAIRGNQLNVIIQYQPNQGDEPSSSFMNLAAEMGSIRILKWFHERGGKINEYVVRSSIIRGDQKLLEWLLPLKILPIADVYSSAIRSVKMSVLEIVYKYYPLGPNDISLFPDLYEIAAIHEKFNIVKWLFAKTGIEISVVVLHYALYYDRWDIFEWIRKHESLTQNYFSSLSKSICIPNEN